MISRRNAMILGILIVAIVVGLECVYRYRGLTKGCAQIVNEGIEPMEGLIAHYGGSSVAVGTLHPDEKTWVWFSGAGRGILSLQFVQKGNPVTGFKVDDFDPSELRRDGSRLVIVVKGDQVVRFVEEDESIKSAPRLLDRLMGWIQDELR